MYHNFTNQIISMYNIKFIHIEHLKWIIYQIYFLKCKKSFYITYVYKINQNQFHTCHSSLC